MLKFFKTIFSKFTTLADNPSHVVLPIFAGEIELEVSFFKIVGVDGYCLERKWFEFSADEMSALIYKSEYSLENKLIAFEQLHKLWNYHLSLDDKVKRICIVPCRPTNPTGNPRIDLFKKTATINHERLHAHITEYELNWFDLVYKELGQKYGNRWFYFASLLINTNIYRNTLERYGYDWLNWVVVNESLARFAAILHTPKGWRLRIAQQQFHASPLLVLEFAEKIEKDYGSVERFIADHVRLHQMQAQAQP